MPAKCKICNNVKNSVTYTNTNTNTLSFINFNHVITYAYRHMKKTKQNGGNI